MWGLFCELSAGRSGNGGGPNPISWQDIRAWQDVTGRPLARWEVVAVKALDGIYAQACADSTRKASPPPPSSSDAPR